MDCPCKGCEERTQGCHGWCGRYKAYRADLDNQRADWERLRVVRLYRQEQIHRMDKWQHKHKPKWGDKNG